MAVVFLFGGQGSQFYRMGEELLRVDPIFAEWMERGDAVLRRDHGWSLLDELYAPARRSSDPFDSLETSHPAIFIFEVALARALAARGVHADAALGASLGEVSACALAGVVVFEDAVRALASQAKALASGCRAGGMIAILADPAIYMSSPLLNQRSEIGGILGPSHFVVASPEPWFTEVEAHLRNREILYSTLPVRQPFHSRWLHPIPEEAKLAFETVVFRLPSLPVISCRTTAVMERPTAAQLWQSALDPIRFRDTILRLEREAPHIYVDATPGGTMANLVRANLGAAAASRTYAVSSPFGREADGLERVANALSAASAARR